MASGAVYDAIKAHLIANWSTTLIAFENENADSNGTAIPPNPVVPWVDVEMTGTLYGQASLGASLQADNRWDEEGILFLHVLVEGGLGAHDARTYAKSLADLFRGLTLLSGSLEFRDAYIGRGVPGRRDGNWFSITTSIEWRRIDA